MMENVTVRKSTAMKTEQEPDENSGSGFFHQMLEEILPALKDGVKSTVVQRTQRADAAAKQATTEAEACKARVIQSAAKARAARNAARRQQSEVDQLTAHYTMLRKVRRPLLLCTFHL